jgi:hypothetical protein
MARILDILLTALKDRGLTEIEARRFIKDTYKVLDRERYVTATGLKKAIESLGWDRDILDHFIFKLLVLFVEDQGSFGACSYSFH